MVLIGFVLIAAAAVIGIDITAQNNFAVEIDAFGQILSTTAAGMFVAGIVVGLAAAVGIMLMRDGMVRSRRARAQSKASIAERDRMAAAYAREHGLEGRAREAREDGEVDLTEREMDREHVTTF
ncbi:MAG TPA: hypothetical protein VFV00_15390 [Acidimicrobiales bacterium]|nr:hypothetical protein [Acidimicrobiales bacterium]